MTCFLSGLSQNMKFLQGKKKLIFNHSGSDETNIYQNHQVIQGAKIFVLQQIIF